MKCKTCIRIYDYKTAYPCRYCIHNNERHTYMYSMNNKDEDYYREAKNINSCDSELPF